MSEYNECLRTKKVVSGNDFLNMFEVLGLFGISKKGIGCGVFEVPGSERVVSLMTEERGKVSVERKFGEKRDSRGWREVVELVEFCPEEDLEEYLHQIKSENRTRSVFFKMSRGGVSWWKFIGVFEIDVVKVDGGIGSICYVKKSDATVL